MRCYPIFDPFDMNPWLLCDRDGEREGLKGALSAWLQASCDGSVGGQTWAITGGKGVGKSILTRAILRDLKEAHSAGVLFATVDCRRARSWREVLALVAAELVRELGDLQRVGLALPPGALDTARVVSTLSALDAAQLKEAHERVRQFKAAASMGGAVHKLLSAEFDISVERSEREIRALEGAVTFDEHRLGRLIEALFRDLRSASLACVLYLDNVDELDHDYHDAEARRRVRREVEGILKLRDAPVGLVLNLRSYFMGVLPREANAPIPLRSLPAAELVAILERRLSAERPEIRVVFESDATKAAVALLAERAPSPLVFLQVVRELAQDGSLEETKLAVGLRRLVAAIFTPVADRDLQAALGAFPRPDAEIPRADLLGACGSEAVLRQLEDCQVVLPKDFWNPNHYTLDPLLQLVHPRAGRP
ncbi:MAG: AAA family ATPase [Pseudomonadota bacterium]